ncbi:MAG: metallophosphoesterase [Ruminococcaceae bacterium]|nr:metallophosphoesterase [Oscillospiraceae bacterium]
MKQSTWILRCAATALFLITTNLLIALHLMRTFTIRHTGHFLLCYAGALLLLIVCFRRIRSDAPYAIRCIGAYGMGLYVTLVMVTVVCFLLPLPGWVTLLAALLLAAYGFAHAGQIHVRRYKAPILSRPFRLVLISDVHLGAVGSEERLPRLIDCINAEKPDLVCIAGDLIDNCFEAVRNPVRAATLLRRIESRCGVYACLGNHDAGDSAEAMQHFMAKSGIAVLAETYKTVDGVQILGRLDAKPHGNYVNQVRGDTEALLSANPRPDLPLIVMDHNPSAIPQYDSRCTLLLCGHTHNGQILPGNLVIKAINICGYGYYRKDEHSPHVVVSSGAGAWGPPMRIGTNCEIAVIDLGT